MFGRRGRMRLPVFDSAELTDELTVWECGFSNGDELGTAFR